MGIVGPRRRLHRVGVEWAAFHAFPAGGGRQRGRRRQQHQYQYSWQGIRRPYPRISAAGRFEARPARSRRVEYLETYRQMGPMGFPANTADNRQGWYVQAGYFLTGVHPDFLGATLNKYLTRLEPIVRYSGVNQRGIVVDDVSMVPALGSNGSPSIFSPHAREVALGLDYWIAPSIVWQTEFDIELPRAGGLVIDPSN